MSGSEPRLNPIVGQARNTEPSLEFIQLTNQKAVLFSRYIGWDENLIKNKRIGVYDQ